MSERKVLQKYYPPDFDPSALKRTPKHLRPTGPKTIPVRLMAPFSMKCTSCGEYIYKGRKFNARKETTDEKYLNISIIRFYIRCTRCSTEITFKTDPKNTDYTCERGAKRNFEMWRDPNSTELQESDEQRLDRLEREEAEEAEEAEKNAMEELEQKMEESKREMAVADALDEIRTRNARIERGEKGQKEEQAILIAREEVEKRRKRENEELEEAARLAFSKENVERVLEEAIEVEDEPVMNHTFERVVRPRKADVKPLAKKVEIVKTVPAMPTTKPVVSSGLGLAAYGSDDDDDDE